MLVEFKETKFWELKEESWVPRDLDPFTVAQLEPASIRFDDAGKDQTTISFRVECGEKKLDLIVNLPHDDVRAMVQEARMKTLDFMRDTIS